MQALLTLIMSIFNIYIMVVVLRLWLQLNRADFYNPFSQFTVKATQPIIGPLRRIIPSIGALDTATLVFAILLSFAKVLIYIAMTAGGIPEAIFSAMLFSILNLINQIMWLVFWIVVIRALLSWFSQGSNPIELVMHQLTDPLLRPLRKVIPPIGGLDLSVLVFLLGFQFLINLYGSFFGPFV